MTGVTYLFWEEQNALQKSLTTGSFSSILSNGTAITFKGYSVDISIGDYIPISSNYNLDQNEINYLFALFVIFLICTVLLFIFTIAMVRRVRVAIAILKETSIIFSKMPLIFLFPLGLIICIALLFVYFLMILVLLMAAVDPAVINIVGTPITSPSIS
jgi:hypothetical protein